jgi:alpha-methylacyl-CoA racemase
MVAASGPLDGIKVLDLSRLLPGPAATWHLAGLGATIDRVETPGRGDFTRYMPPMVDGVGAVFAAVSTGKRSLGVNLRHPDGPGVIRSLLKHYDVLVEGFRPGVLEAMGLAPQELLAEHPGLIVVRISGFGQDGPLRNKPAHDVNYVGYTGALASAAHGPQGPALAGVLIADWTSGMVAAMGAAAALVEREQQRARGETPSGRVIDVSMTECALSLMGPSILGASMTGANPKPGGEMLTGGAPLYGCYETADGSWLTLGALEPKFQAEVARAVGDVPMSHEGLAEVFRTRTRDVWLSELSEACAGPLHTPADAATEPLFLERGAVQRVGKGSFVRPPLGVGTTAGAVPGIGEHTDQVLADGGFTADRIDALRTAGAIG